GRRRRRTAGVARRRSVHGADHHVVELRRPHQGRDGAGPPGLGSGLRPLRAGRLGTRPHHRTPAPVGSTGNATPPELVALTTMSTASETQIDIRRADDRFKTKIGWLDSKHSFSFSRHWDPGNTHHGLLLV